MYHLCEGYFVSTTTIVIIVSYHDMIQTMRRKMNLMIYGMIGIIQLKDDVAFWTVKLITRPGLFKRPVG